MSLKASIAANYASQLYATLIGILIVPLYVRYMGTEAYGLVGFFGMLQAWFNLLDLGLTPTISRESARFRGGAISALDYRRVYRLLSVVFFAIAVCGGIALLLMAGTIADRWLKPESLATADVVEAMRIMAVCVALRWMSGLYRGVVTGAERLVWLGGFNAFIATLRFAAVLLSMWLWGFTPTVFFWHQMAVAALEVLMLRQMCRSLLPVVDGFAGQIGWSFEPVRPLVRFSLTIAFTSSVWVLVTQTDKLILSGILPLAEYGYFTLAVLMAGGITILTSPVSIVVLPRIARLHALGDRSGVRRLYGEMSQVVSITAGAAAVTLVFAAEPVLFAWTGSRQIAEACAPVLRLYAIGNGLLALGAFPYYLQYAMGDLRYHLIGNVALVVLLVPALIFAATRAGSIGAGWAWVAVNALYLFGWVAFVHSRLEPGLHLRWLFTNLFATVLPATVVGWLIAFAPFDEQSRWSATGHVLLAGICALLAAALCSPVGRDKVFGRTVKAA